MFTVVLSGADAKVVLKYENFYVTPFLNPFPRGKDLLSLRSKLLMFVLYLLLYYLDFSTRPSASLEMTSSH